jgi:DNA-binding NtrC family response regulator
MKKKILLVDDDDAVRRMLGRLLADEDYVVIPASDGCEALKTAAARGVDLVLLDLNSPAEEVRQTLEQFTRENPHLPVIVTTRSPQISRSSVWAAALMEKPLDLPKLLRTISTLLAAA